MQALFDYENLMIDARNLEKQAVQARLRARRDSHLVNESPQEEAIQREKYARYAQTANIKTEMARLALVEAQSALSRIHAQRRRESRIGVNYE